MTAAGPGDRPTRARWRRTAEADVDRLLRDYCRLVDAADLDGFAALFTHGTWCGLTGSDAVRRWLEENVILHDGRTLTRHDLHDVRIDVAASGLAARSTCAITVTQDLGDGPRLLVTRNTYTDTFARVGGAWWFHTRRITQREPGDDTHHRRRAVPDRRTDDA